MNENITEAMAEARSNVRLMADAGAELRSLEKRNRALVTALQHVQESLREMSGAVHLQIVVNQALDDERMGWSAR